MQSTSVVHQYYLRNLTLSFLYFFHYFNYSGRSRCPCLTNYWGGQTMFYNLLGRPRPPLPPRFRRPCLYRLENKNIHLPFSLTCHKTGPFTLVSLLHNYVSITFFTFENLIFLQYKGLINKSRQWAYT